MKPKLLFLTVDALGESILERGETPFIDKLRSDGFTPERARSLFPTLTTPMMSSILTGCYPDTHSIACNSRLDRDTGLVRGKLRDLKVPTLGEILVQEGYTVASVQHFMLENRAGIDYTQIEVNSTQKIKELVLGAMEDHTAVFAIFQSVDSAGHRFGPFHAKTLEALSEVDGAIGELVDAWKGERFVLALSSDHSMSYANMPSDFSLAEILDSLGLEGRFLNEGDSARGLDVAMLRYPTVPIFLLSERAKQLGGELLERLRKAPEIGATYSKPEMEALGNGGYADISYSLKKGYSTEKEILKVVEGYGYHGTENEADSIITFYGPEIRKGRIPEMKLIDILPTTLAFLGLDYQGEVDGKNLRGVGDAD